MIVGDTRLLVESQAVVLRLPRSAFVWNRPLAATFVRNGCGQRVQIHRRRTKGVHSMIATTNGSASSPAALPVGQQTNELFDRVLAAAKPSAVFSAPTISGAYTVVTASEVFAGGGFGFGGGGGGGGVSHSRPVAAVVIGPHGVKVRPIVDATRIALAVMAMCGGVALMAMRVARAQARANHHRHHR
jgi:hypothetical protein